MFEKFLAMAQPAVHLRKSEFSGFTKAGGRPHLPPEVAWPEVDGRLLPFLMQVDLSDVSASLPSFLPAHGALYFFFDQDRYEEGQIHDKHLWSVLYYPGDPRELTERSDRDRIDLATVYRTKPLSAVKIRTLPSHYRFPGEFDEEADLIAYAKLADHDINGHITDPYADAIADHHLLGHAQLRHGGEPELDCECRARGVDDVDGCNNSARAALIEASGEWKLLCQIDTDFDLDWMWGDFGTLYFWVRENDARSGRFDRVWMTLDCL